MKMKPQFTGNWFIDAGILGFVNLMEEFYGSKLKENFNRNISKEEFYKAYFFYHIRKGAIELVNKQTLTKDASEKEKERFNESKKRLINFIENLRLKTSSNKRKKIRKEIKDLNRKVKNKIKKEFNKFKKKLKKVFSNNKKTIIQKIEEIGIIFNEPFFQNLSFANPTKNKAGKEDDVLKSFEEMVFEHKVKKKLTKNAFDKTISKFLFSESEFPNICYSKIQTIDDLDRLVGKNSIIYLLCFPLAFRRVSGRFIFFYSINPKFCYHVNKKIALLVKRIGEKKDDIFNITWQSIIDTLVEYKSEFSLENMYLIEYKSVQQQALKNVEYIGIPKLQAQILLDDHLRGILNKNLKIKGKNYQGKEEIWLLEEFIKGKPLFPLALKHVKLRIDEKRNKIDFSIFYTLLMDAAILEFQRKVVENENRKVTLFSKDFLSGNYKEIVQKIKREFSIAYYYTTQRIPKYFWGKEEKERFAQLLLHALFRNNKSRFLYIVLKQLNIGSMEDLPMLHWIFNKIVKNDISWKEYGLLVVAGLVC